MSEPESPVARSDRSPWNWLLFIPIVLPVLTPIFNFDTPRLWGFPAFYWLQFLFILVGVTTTSIVYQMTKKPVRASAPVSPAPVASAPEKPAASAPEKPAASAPEKPAASAPEKPVKDGGDGDE